MKIIIVGGAGFIGSNLVKGLLHNDVESIIVYDNFSSGKLWHLGPAASDRRVHIVRAEVEDTKALGESVSGADVVYHLASNPDIARAAREPTIDFYQGTLLTQLVLEAARVGGVKRVIYASGSGVFGDNPGRNFSEDDISPAPNSTYAASKLAGEVLLSAYAHMFGLVGLTFRFANVVGANQTHGVGYDFIRKLRVEPGRLDVLGDGTQSKSYIYVDDVVQALILALNLPVAIYDYYNLSTEDYITVKEIVGLVTEEMGLKDVAVNYGAGNRGWKGDVPVIRFTAAKARAIGWRCGNSSANAMRLAVRGMLANFAAGQFSK